MRFASAFAYAAIGALAAVAFPAPASGQPSVLDPPADAAAGAHAGPGSARAPAPADFDERLVLDTGRFEPPPPVPSSMSLSLHGAYQLRYRAMDDLRLEAPASDPDATTLGQNQSLYHWLRVSPQLRYRDKITLVAQIDVLRGLLGGDTTQHVDQVRDGHAVAVWHEVHPRYLYIELSSSVGVFRVGQQGAHWGAGLLVNDGDHPTLFGDYQRGALVERVLFEATPMGAGAPLTVTVAGDLVFEDNGVDLLGNDLAGSGIRYGDRALQGVAAVLWRAPRGEIGLYGVVRRQERARQATGELGPAIETSTSGALDVAGKFNAPAPGGAAYVYGAIEAAMVLGSTTVAWSAGAPTGPNARRRPEAMRSFGAAGTLGAVHVAGRGAGRWGRVVTELEVGYASGDADPYDGVSRRFTFDPNHNVGLVLFDQVLAWKTARAATLAQDERVVGRAPPGIQKLPSQGGVFGAAYANPRVVVRPAGWLDLKAGAVIAQTTADLVDPYRASVLESIGNYDGGDERAHDLGAEIDVGFEARVATSDLFTLQFGAEGGVLFPGRAFNDAAGNRLSSQYLLTLELGLIY